MTALVPDTTSGGPMPGEFDLMVVTIRDESREAPWGVGRVNPCVRSVAIADHCSRCRNAGHLAVRGRPVTARCHEDGANYWVQRWTNPCGHIDWYSDVVAEADRIAADRGAGRWVRIYPDADSEAAGLAEHQDVTTAAENGGPAAHPFRRDRNRAPHELHDEFVLTAVQTVARGLPAPGIAAITRHTTHRLRVRTTTPCGVVDYRWTPPDRETAGHLAGEIAADRLTATPTVRNP